MIPTKQRWHDRFRYADMDEEQDDEDDEYGLKRYRNNLTCGFCVATLKPGVCMLCDSCTRCNECRRHCTTCNRCFGTYFVVRQFTCIRCNGCNQCKLHCTECMKCHQSETICDTCKKCKGCWKHCAGCKQCQTNKCTRTQLCFVCCGCEYCGTCDWQWHKGDDVNGKTIVHRRLSERFGLPVAVLHRRCRECSIALFRPEINMWLTKPPLGLPGSVAKKITAYLMPS